MARSDAEDLQLFLSRVRPIYHQLFNIAHAITGSCELAEYSLQYALMDYWNASGGSHHGFREGLRNTLIHAAVRDALAARNDRPEFTWNGLTSEAPEAEPDPMRRITAGEPVETRRILVLRYGCGFAPNRIARLMQTDVGRVLTLLRRFEARARRKLALSDSKRFHSLIAQTVRSDLALPNAYVPDMGNVFRSFMADADSILRPNRLPARILHAIVAVIMAVVCMLVFWFAAVLMQPAAIVDDGDTQVGTAADEA